MELHNLHLCSGTNQTYVSILVVQKQTDLFHSLSVDPFPSPCLTALLAFRFRRLRLADTPREPWRRSLLGWRRASFVHSRFFANVRELIAQLLDLDLEFDVSRRFYRLSSFQSLGQLGDLRFEESRFIALDGGFRIRARARTTRDPPVRRRALSSSDAFKSRAST